MFRNHSHPLPVLCYTCVMNTLALLFILAAVPSAGMCATYFVSFGQIVGRNAVEGWHVREGPYTQFDNFFKKAFRWGKSDTRISLPVFPGIDNRATMFARIGSHPDQELTVRAGDKVLLKTGYSSEDEYSFIIPADVIGKSSSILLDLSVKEITWLKSADPERLLYIALALVRVTADGAVESFSNQDPRVVGTNSSPDMWRFSIDPKDQGDNVAKPTQYFDPGYDDSGWPVVRPSKWKGTGAVWYRGFIRLDPEKRKPMRVKLPVGGDLRTLFVNGRKIEPADGLAQEQAAAAALKEGLTCVVVKLERWPEPMITSGDPSGIIWRTQDGLSGTSLIIDALPANASVDVSGPRGFRALKAQSPALPIAVPLTHFGRYGLSVSSDGENALIPIHFMGLSFFHWGWYGPGGCGMNGPSWKEFNPTSNNFIDQLFERVDAHLVKHHALSYSGWIYEDPATQPLAKRAGRGFAVVKEKDYIAETSRLISKDKLDLVGMPYVARSVDEADGEELVRSLRFSREIYKNQLGIEPNYFKSHDGTIMPQLPQIMRLTGYDSYVICENWWGEGSVPNTSDCVWKSMDGTSVDVLNSYHHGYSVMDKACRAAREGKPVVLSAEEFACLDPTKFFEESERLELEKMGIIIRPISLDRYRKEIADWASSRVASKDSEMAYKGWTGGSPAETEYESLIRIILYKLAAAENTVSFARILGYELPQSEIDDIWKICMIYNDCHLHWRGSILEEWCHHLRELKSRTAEIQREAAKFVAEQVGTSGKSVVVVNSLGWPRSGLAKVEIDNGQAILDSNRRPVPQERRGGEVIFWADDVPALGVKAFAVGPASQPAAGASLQQLNDGFEMSNLRIKVIVTRDGIILSDAEGRVLCRDANLYSVKPPERRPFEPISLWDRPLNPDHYAPVRLLAVEAVNTGPAEASVAISGTLAYDPWAKIEGSVGLGADSDSVRISLKLICAEPAAIGIQEAACGHEGQYMPGLFFGFPCGDSDDIVVDKAYCLAKNTLMCGNRETFMQLPFKYRTTNGLSLAAPASGDFAVLSHGLTDFFHIPWAGGNLIGVSFGSGLGRRGPEPYLGEYVYRLALYAPSSGKLWKAYTRAQEEIVPLEAFVTDKKPNGRFPTQGSLLSVDAENVIITGVESDGTALRIRVLELAERQTTTTLHGLFPLKTGSTTLLNLPPRALREITEKNTGVSVE
jgi:hypothetical protein